MTGVFLERAIKRTIAEFIEIAGELRTRPIRPVTTHHYHATDPLDGAFGVVGVDRHTIQEYIGLGCRDAARPKAAVGRRVVAGVPGPSDPDGPSRHGAAA